MHGYKVTVKDLILEPMTPQQVRDLLITMQPDMVGISAISATFPAAQRICRLSKRLLPNTITVVGGTHTYAPGEELLNEQTIDFAIRYDGEGALIELIEALNYPGAVTLADIPGLIYRKDGQIVDQTTRKLINPLDALPFIDRSVVPLSHYADSFTMSGSRGCPGHCVYCVSAIQPYRLRGLNTVLSEIYWLYTEKKARSLYLSDNVLIRIEQICDFIRENCPDLQWCCDCRVDTVDEALLTKMYESGCFLVEFGIESGNQAVLDRLEKNTRLEDVHRMVHHARSIGLEVVCTYMLGHFCDTRETVQETVNLIRELGEKYQVRSLLSFNTLFPGTHQTLNREELGLKAIRDDYGLFDPDVPNIRGHHFSSEDLRQFYFEVMNWVDQTYPV
jgi:radical SAM superfamily enzyme YgiQ (UPF0313 family)